MRVSCAIAVVTLALMPSASDALQAPRAALLTADEQHTEVVVYEAGRCAACSRFRDAIVRPYFRSDRGDALPMHVIDFDALGTAGRALRAPVTELPTSVVLRGGIEIGRVVGNPGATGFLAAIDRFAAPEG